MKYLSLLRLQRDELSPADDAEQPTGGGDVGVIDTQQRELRVHLVSKYRAL